MFKFLKHKLGKLLKKEIKELEGIGEKKIKEKFKEEKEKNIFKKFKKKISTVKISEEKFEIFFSDLEILLIENNIALEAIDFIKKRLKEDLIGSEIKKRDLEEEIRKSLKLAILDLLPEPFDFISGIRKKIKIEKPYKIVFFGINGSGKTTTIAKVAYYLKSRDISCVLAASDTFRAASIEQLEEHAKKLNLKLIKHKYGSDPAAVSFDAVAHAKSKGIDVVLIDTAGRMHSNENLMEEMKKICRVIKPDLKIFVAESITGNDAIKQAESFNNSVGIDAIILTKTDIDEKSGTVISISYVIKKPILFLGTGQSYNDLEKFNSEKIIKSFGL